MPLFTAISVLFQNQKMSKILSFDTSNYTTSACVFDTDCGVVWENRIMLSVASGECGIRQNDAVFLHTKNINGLFDSFDVSGIDTVVASKCPSEKENSYMPCFTVGVSFAKVISNILNIPFYSYSHQKNHICAALYSADKINLLKSPFIAYHISGGTTDVCLCEPSDIGGFSVKKIGGTYDISCGQLIDRTGVNIGLNFPCGKQIEQLADKTLISGKIKIKNNDGFYNFSGFQNKTEQMYSNGHSKEQISSYCLDIVYSFLKNSISYFRAQYGNLPVLLSGGVMSNIIIAELASATIENIYFSDPKYSVDNSLGCAILCAYERGLIR